MAQRKVKNEVRGPLFALTARSSTPRLFLFGKTDYQITER